MGTPQFTPGPWYLTQSEAGAPRYIREEASDAVLAYVEDGGHVDPKFSLSEEEQLANGRLMAMAPQLFALAASLEWSAQVDRPQGGTEEGCPHCDAAKRWGHVPDCKLAATLNKVRAEQVPA